MLNFEDFLIDHASCEKKASSMALKLIAHYPDKTEILEPLAELAIEELTHYKEVLLLLLKRGLHPTGDQKDLYMSSLKQHIRRGPEAYLMDQLLLASIVEARGYERFSLIAEALPNTTFEKKFYTAISHSEKRHYELFLSLGEIFFDKTLIQQRLNQLLKIESNVMINLPIHARLH